MNRLPARVVVHPVQMPCFLTWLDAPGTSPPPTADAEARPALGTTRYTDSLAVSLDVDDVISASRTGKRAELYLVRDEE